MVGPGIKLEGVNLHYPSSPLRTFSIKECAFNLVRWRKNRSLIHDVHALRSVSLTVTEGQRVGVIGPNGAGKTTLLKAISGIYPVQSGSVEVTGQIQSLFDLNLGFEFEGTGRENITYRGLLMGRKPEEIAAKEKEAVEFADIGEFIDYPVKTYSAGMLVRLAFAISTSFEPNILLLDEVFKAGDAKFRQKARERMNSLISRSQILLFVSHDLGSIRDICDRAIHMEGGRIVNDGPSDTVTKAYGKNFDRKGKHQPRPAGASGRGRRR
jgi:lipopolysaccharide transport system ATP-binding protein